MRRMRLLIRGRLALVVAVLMPALLAATPVRADPPDAKATPDEPARKADWEELIPPDWDPTGAFGKQDPARILEGSATELSLMRKVREYWDKAPTRPELDGQRLRLPGYVVPLDPIGGKVKEFLLVPYFGACIHTPPPPANQIIHVKLGSAHAMRAMDTVWVSGRLATERRDTEMGMSGYSMKAEGVEPYGETTR